MTCHVALNRAIRGEARDVAANGSEDVCIVCGDASAELICQACHRLIGARPMKREEFVASARGPA